MEWLYKKKKKERYTHTYIYIYLFKILPRALGEIQKDSDET